LARKLGFRQHNTSFKIASRRRRYSALAILESPLRCRGPSLLCTSLTYTAMDVEVEMVRSPGEKDGVVAAENLETIAVRPRVRWQNTTCGLALVSLLLGLSVFLVYEVYMSPGEMGTEGYYQPGSGEVSNEDKKAKVSEAMGRIKTHKGHGNAEQWMKDNIGKRHKDNNNDGHEEALEIRKWKEAKVTITDGKKYEVEEKLEHDPLAFLYVKHHFVS